MMNKRLACIFAVYLASVTGLTAQNFTKFNFGESELIRINPASAIEDGNQAYIAYKNTWSKSSGYGEKPYDFDIGATAAFDWGALSGEFDYDGYSFFDRHDIKLNYSYVWKINDRRHSRFSIGGGITFGIDNVNFDKLGYPGVLMGRKTYCSPDINIGFEYNNRHIRTGIGAMNLIACRLKFNVDKNGQNPPKRDSKGAELIRNPRTIMAYFIYRFNLHKVGLSPMVFTGYCERSELMIGFRADYDRWIAFSYNFRAMEMGHIFTLNFTIPKTPVTLDISYTKSAFYKDQNLAAALRVHW